MVESGNLDCIHCANSFSIFIMYIYERLRIDHFYLCGKLGQFDINLLPGIDSVEAWKKIKKAKGKQGQHFFDISNRHSDTTEQNVMIYAGLCRIVDFCIYLLTLE